MKELSLMVTDYMVCLKMHEILYSLESRQFKRWSDGLPDYMASLSFRWSGPVTQLILLGVQRVDQIERRSMAFLLGSLVQILN